MTILFTQTLTDLLVHTGGTVGTPANKHVNDNVTLEIDGGNALILFASFQLMLDQAYGDAQMVHTVEYGTELDGRKYVEMMCEVTAVGGAFGAATVEARWLPTQLEADSVVYWNGTAGQMKSYTESVALPVGEKLRVSWKYILPPA